MAKFNLSETGAVVARNNGWTVKKDGPSINVSPNGKLPKGICVEDVISDAKVGAVRVKCCFNISLQEFDDIMQVAILRLLEQTAAKGFKSPVWRKKVAYNVSLNYIQKEIFKIKHRFFRFDLEKLEDDLSDKKIFLKNMENLIDFKDIMNQLSTEDKRMVVKWIISTRRKPTKKVIKILKSVQNR